MLRSTIFTILAALVLSSVAYAHGGSWRGPTARTPGDPNPSAPPGPSTWSSTWKLNREQILKLRELQEDRLKARTPSTSPHFFGDGDGSASREERKSEAWNAILDTLMEAAREKHPDVSTGAVVALGKAGDPRALPLLMELVKDDRVHHTVNESAALAIGMIGEGGLEVRQFLERTVADPTRRTRTRALAAVGLGFLGDPGAIPALMSFVHGKEKSRDVPTCSILAVGLLADEMLVPDLAQALSGPIHLREKDDFLRAYHGAALGIIGSRTAIPALIRSLRDKEVEVRRQAAMSLAALAGPEDKDVSEALVRTMKTDRDHGVQAFCAIALGEIGTPEPEALLWAYREGNPTLVPYAALAMGLWARRGTDPEIAGKIRTILHRDFVREGNLNKRGALTVALGVSGERKAIPDLLKLLRSKSEPGVRSHAAIALGLIGAEEAIPDLRKLLTERASPALQHESAIALSLMGDRGATQILLKLVREGSSEYVKGSAAAALGRLADLDTAMVLREILADKTNQAMTRAFVAVALGKAMDRRPYPILSRIGTHLNHSMAVDAVLEMLTIL